MSDPTGTAGLRRSFLAEGTRRLARVRSLTHTMLVEHDLMAARNDPLAQFLPHPGNRLSAFTQWFEQTVNTQLLGGRWWERFLERAYHSGFVAGSALARVPPTPTPLPAVFRELASREFAGIAAALVQQVTRQAAGAALGRRKPLPMYRQILPVLRKVGLGRVRMAIDTLTVKIHNSGRLAQFRAAGIKRVGIDPERLEPRKPSRFLKHDHRLHDRETAVQKSLREVQELLAKQQREREEEQAQAEAELEAYRERLAAEIESHQAGAVVSRTAAQAVSELAAAQARAEEEVAAARAATAEREAAAAEAWQNVLAARKEARAAEYAAKATAGAVEKEAAQAARKEARAAEKEAEVEQAVAPEPAAEAIEAVAEVNVQTYGDDRVCDECDDIAAAGPYTLDEFDELIPAHPRCRCTPVPAVDDAANPDQLSLLQEETG